ncbi:MAG: protein translocase subunit SecF [Firmicutes bacterium]|nr:protein translocase subunit SecF [Bacillota bacterium]MDH7495035.1 protein translocase subunit SecF [Bacillota bacterium]
MDIIGKRRLFLAISGILVVCGIIALLTRGLNLGVDFTGGSLLRLRFERPVRASEVSEALTGAELADMHLQKAVVQPISGTNDVQVRAQVGGRPLNDEQIGRIVAALSRALGQVSVVESQLVEGVIGRELLSKALMAVLVSWIGIVVYVSLRFEFKFAVAAVLALIHDTIIVLGAFAVMGRQVNSPFIAAVLTIIGYSINDTIVIFDKIRENLRLRKKETLEELTNKSLLQTLRRSLNTVATTLLAVVALFLFGGASIKDFSLALMIGLIVGTYSSIFVASPVWLEWRMWERARQQRRAAAGAKTRETGPASAR